MSSDPRSDVSSNPVASDSVQATDLSSAAPAKPRSRWLLKTLLAVMFVSAAILGARAFRGIRQSLIVERIYEANGQVRFDYHGQKVPQPAGVEFMRMLLGDQYFVTAVEVQMARPDLTDKELGELAGDLRSLPYLDTITLDYAQVTDKGIEHLAGLSRLRRISLYETAVTAGGKRRLQALLPGLRQINIGKKPPPS